MQKFAVGNDGAAQYSIKFDGSRYQDPFVVEWLGDPNEDKKMIEDRVSQLNFVFKKSIEYYPGSLHGSPSWVSRRYLRREEDAINDIFKIMGEIGIDHTAVKAMIKNLVASKFEMSDAIEALMEANYYAWEKINMIESNDRVFKHDFDQLKREHENMMIEIKKLKRDADIQ